jgi:hypothetical protein
LVRREDWRECRQSKKANGGREDLRQATGWRESEVHGKTQEI